MSLGKSALRNGHSHRCEPHISSGPEFGGRTTHFVRSIEPGSRFLGLVARSAVSPGTGEMSRRTAAAPPTLT
jgi:hypothetical protein